MLAIYKVAVRLIQIMKMPKCPQCGGKLSPSVSPLRPMEAIAADMIELAVVFRCPNCALYSTDASGVECPKVLGEEPSCIT